MKNLIKYWHVVGGVLVAIYETTSYFSGLDIIPLKVKGIIGVIAGIGFVIKTYYQNKAKK